MASRTWFWITLSDDFKLCDTTMPNTFTMLVMYPTSTTPVNSNTSGASGTRIKTLLLCSRHCVLPSANCLRIRMYDPARWTADSRRRCCCITKHGLTVIWLTSTYTQTSRHRVIKLQTVLHSADTTVVLLHLCHFLPRGAYSGVWYCQGKLSVRLSVCDVEVSWS